MKWPIKAIGTVAVLSGTLLAGASMAEHMGPGPGGPPHGLFGRPLAQFILGQRGRRMVLDSELNLTPRQHEQIRSIIESHRTEIDQVAKELVSEGRDVRAAVLADKSDDHAVRQAAGGLTKGLGDAAVLVAHIRTEVVPLLTTQQIQAIESFRADSDKAVDHFLDELGQAAPSEPPPPPEPQP